MFRMCSGLPSTPRVTFCRSLCFARRPTPREATAVYDAPASIAVPDELLRGRVLAGRQRVGIMAAVRGHALQNACATLVMRELCGFAEHVVQHRSLGNMFHVSILDQEGEAERSEQRRASAAP